MGAAVEAPGCPPKGAIVRRPHEVRLLCAGKRSLGMGVFGFASHRPGRSAALACRSGPARDRVRAAGERGWLTKVRLLGAIQVLRTDRSCSRATYPGVRYQIIQGSSRTLSRKAVENPTGAWRGYTKLSIALIQPSWLFSSRYAPALATRSTGQSCGFAPGCMRTLVGIVLMRRAGQ